MKEKLLMIENIFKEGYAKESIKDSDGGVLSSIGILNRGTAYGGIYQGRKYLYSKDMIESMPIEKLEAVIRGQLGI